MTARSFDQDAPASVSRPARMRGPIPASSSSEQSSLSTRVALPPLPLARTVNRSAIELLPQGWFLAPKPGIEPEDSAPKQGQGQAGDEQSDIVLEAKLTAADV